MYIKQFHKKLIELSDSNSKTDILNGILDAFHSVFEPDIVFIGILVDEERSLIEGHCALRKGVPSEPWVYSMIDQPCGLVYEQGRVSIPHGVQQNFVRKAGSGLECFIGLPVNRPGIGTVAHMAAYDSKPNNFDDLNDETIALLNTLIEREFWKIRFQQSDNLVQIIDDMGLGLQWIDARSSEVLKTNDTIERMTGIQSLPDAPSTLDQYDNLISQRHNEISKPLTHQQMRQFDTEYVCADGNQIPVEVRSTLFPANTLMPEHHVRLVNDITERVKQTEELNQANNELESALEMQKHFFAILGHELRTPVASMHMLLEDKLLPQQEIDEYLRATTSSLIDVLEGLRYVIAPADRKQAEYKNENLHNLISNITGSLSGLLRRKGYKLQIVSDTLGNITCLPNKIIRQVCTNLIKNAALHSKGDQIKVTLFEKQLSETEVSTVIRIEDNGVGINPEFAAKMFQPFSRGGSEEDGTGLGLFIVKELCTLANIQLSYSNLPKNGSAFELRAVFELIDKHSTQVLNRTNETELEGVRILVAEDNDMLQLLTKKLLSKMGAEVSLAGDGELALEVIDNEPKGIDVVLTDINMPNMDGFELTKALKARGFSGKIIGCTAADDVAETEQLIACGASKVIQKPINPTAVLEALGLS